MAKQTHNERIQALEHTINGNGAIGMRQQIDEIRKEVRTLKYLLWSVIAIGIFVLGENILPYVLKLLSLI